MYISCDFVLYSDQAYTAWCEESGEYKLGKNAFGVKLSEHGLRPERHGNPRGWAGLKLNDTWELRQNLEHIYGSGSAAHR